MGTDSTFHLRKRRKARGRNSKAVRAEWKCKTLEDLNSILWPSGKP